MKSTRTLRYNLLFGLILLFVIYSFLPIQNFSTTQFTFKIEESSQLKIEGFTNVNTFTCNCLGQFEPKESEMITANAGEKASFDNAFLLIPISNLDCGHKGMNEDMYETLKADQFPEIKIELKEANQKQGLFLQNYEEWGALKVRAELTIAGVVQSVEMKVSVKKVSE